MPTVAPRTVAFAVFAVLVRSAVMALALVTGIISGLAAERAAHAVETPRVEANVGDDGIRGQTDGAYARAPEPEQHDRRPVVSPPSHDLGRKVENGRGDHGPEEEPDAAESHRRCRVAGGIHRREGSKPTGGVQGDEEEEPARGDLAATDECAKAEEEAPDNWHVHAEVPKPLLALIVPLEVISQFMRLISLSVRLFANMLAGHMLILVMLGLIFIFSSWFLIPISVLAGTVIYLFEVGIVVTIQAFVFALLSAIYIGAAIEPQH